MTNSEQRCWLGLMVFIVGLNIFVTIIHNWPPTYPDVQTPSWVYEPGDILGEGENHLITDIRPGSYVPDIVVTPQATIPSGGSVTWSGTLDGSR